MNVLCLNEKDILNAVTLEEVMEAVESALLLYEKQEFHMPMRMHVEYKSDMLLLMPAFTPGVFGTKLVSLFPGNAEKGIPVLKGTMILNDGETGEPLALLNAAVLTALRTGAVGGVGVKYLAPKNVKRLGVVGAGVQGFHQALFATAVRDFSEVFVYDTDVSRSRALMEKLSRRRPGLHLHAAESSPELVTHSDVIITATASMDPVLPDDETLLKGKHFIGIGSYRPAMREFPEALYKHLEHVYVDTEHAVEESGDLVIPLKNNWIDRKKVLTLGKRIIKKDASYETTLFKSVGMALFDVVVSKTIYQKALDKNLGQEIIL
ncbi:MAG: ornithine cyclodeaminase family protein [bacterium]|nr:ornithine cyclodeaminase family protein [bacterium]